MWVGGGSALMYACNYNIMTGRGINLTSPQYLSGSVSNEAERKLESTLGSSGCVADGHSLSRLNQSSAITMTLSSVE